MGAPARGRPRPYRRRVLAAGVGAGAIVALVGAPWYVRRVERDVEHRVGAAMAVAGLAGVTVTASGQDVRLACEDALDEPQNAVDVAAGVRGVRGIALDRSCRVDEADPSAATVPATVPATRATSTPASTHPTTVAPEPTVATAPPTSTAPVVSVAPLGPGDTTDDPAAGQLRAELDDGVLVMAGTVASQAQHDRMLAAATRLLDPASVEDRLVVDPGADVDDLMIVAYSELVAVMPGQLAEGTARSTADGLDIAGTPIDDDARATVEATARLVEAATDLTDRPVAAASDAEAMAGRIASVLAASPIAFEPLTSVVDASSSAVLDRVAGVLAEMSGIRVTIEGHTDSAGSADDNLALGEARATAVLDALAARGVPADELVAVGRGEQELVLVDGVEDAAASRRVVVRVEVAG